MTIKAPKWGIITPKSGTHSCNCCK